jgi:hypothetical protein
MSMSLLHASMSDMPDLCEQLRSHPLHAARASADWTLNLCDAAFRRDAACVRSMLEHMSRDLGHEQMAIIRAGVLQMLTGYCSLTENPACALLRL